MFRLESYITPLVMNYIDHYVKLKKEDFQISLWGGAASLSQLDLRLDAIEAALNLPVKLSKGHISEMNIQVCVYIHCHKMPIILSRPNQGVTSR